MKFNARLSALFFLFILFLCNLSSVEAQFVPLRKSSTLVHADFPSAATGYLLTIDGTLHKTTNSGADWTVMPFTSGGQFVPSDIQFIDNNTGFISEYNTIFKTTDGGMNWTSSIINQYFQIKALHFTDAATGYAAGVNNQAVGIVLKTTDGGATWATTQIPGSVDLLDIVFTDAQTGYVAGASGQMFKTINGGATWNALTPGTTNILTRLFFFGSTGYVAGYNGTFLKTTDAGATWNPVTIPGETISGNVYFTNATTGYVYSSAGQRKTTDGGLTWTNLSDYPIGDYLFVSPSFAVALSGNLFITTDGGSTWTPNPYFNHLNSVYFPTTTNGFAIGDHGTVFKTTNEGSSWTLVNLNTTNDLKDIFFVNATTGFICGQDGLVMKTTDGGTTWVAMPIPGADWLDIHFANVSDGYIVGSGNSVARTTDGGANWTLVSPSSGFNLFSGVHSFGASGGYAVGNSAGARLTNSAVMQYNITTQSSDQLQALTFINPQTGFAVGSNGVILKTDDAGQTWVELRRGTPMELFNTIQFVDGNNGFITGTRAFYKTNDAGATWTSETVPSPYVFYGSHMLNGTGYVVGQYGAIFFYSTVLTTADKEAGLKKLSIYPNPSTGKVRLSVDETYGNYADLKLMDVLGRVVAAQNISLAGKTDIETSFSVKPGLYTLILQTESGAYTTKVVME